MVAPLLSVDEDTSGTFPEMLKVAIVKPLHKKGIQEKSKTIDPYLSYQSSQK
jgi:hypothetical protein